jgi:putative chitinase
MPTPLTPHFSLEELTSVGPHTGIDNDPPQAIAGNLLRVAEKLEQARAIWNLPVRVSYGYRCEALNTAVGGSPTSAHFLGLAADAIPEGMDLRAAWDALVADPTFCEDVDQLIIERGCVHIGLAVPQHDNLPRHELRLDADVDGVRTYPLYGHWAPNGVERV